MSITAEQMTKSIEKEKLLETVKLDNLKKVKKNSVQNNQQYKKNVKKKNVRKHHHKQKIGTKNSRKTIFQNKVTFKKNT